MGKLFERNPTFGLIFAAWKILWYTPSGSTFWCPDDRLNFVKRLMFGIAIISCTSFVIAAEIANIVLAVMDVTGGGIRDVLKWKFLLVAFSLYGFATFGMVIAYSRKTIAAIVRKEKGPGADTRWEKSSDDVKTKQPGREPDAPGLESGTSTEIEKLPLPAQLSNKYIEQMWDYHFEESDTCKCNADTGCYGIGGAPEDRCGGGSQKGKPEPKCCGNIKPKTDTRGVAIVFGLIFLFGSFIAPVSIYGVKIPPKYISAAACVIFQLGFEMVQLAIFSLAGCPLTKKNNDNQSKCIGILKTGLLHIVSFGFSYPMDV